MIALSRAGNKPLHGIVWIEALQPGDTVEIMIGRHDDRDAAAERRRGVDGATPPGH